MDCRNPTHSVHGSGSCLTIMYFPATFGTVRFLRRADCRRVPCPRWNTAQAACRAGRDTVRSGQSLFPDSKRPRDIRRGRDDRSWRCSRRNDRALCSRSFRSIDRSGYRLRSWNHSFRVNDTIYSLVSPFPACLRLDFMLSFYIEDFISGGIYHGSIQGLFHQYARCRR